MGTELLDYETDDSLMRMEGLSRADVAVQAIYVSRRGDGKAYLMIASKDVEQPQAVTVHFEMPGGVPTSLRDFTDGSVIPVIATKLDPAVAEAVIDLPPASGRLLEIVMGDGDQG